MKKIILDVDTGTDDAVAIMLASQAPNFSVVGITTVVGNCNADEASENSLRVLDYIGKDVPVFTGSPLPMVSTLIENRKFNVPPTLEYPMHGRILDLPVTNKKPEKTHAVSWLIDYLRSSEEKITIIATAPLTNLGIALRIAPDIAESIEEIIIMGGGHQIQNETAAAEFNIWVDPEAAQIVFTSGVKIQLIPLDATHKALISLNDCEYLEQFDTKAIKATVKFVRKRIEGYRIYQPLDDQDSTPLHDALAVCALIDPSVVTTKFVNVNVDFHGGFADGQTVCDMEGRFGGKPNINFAYTSDKEKFLNILADILGERYSLDYPSLS